MLEGCRYYRDGSMVSEDNPIGGILGKAYDGSDSEILDISPMK